MALAPVAYTLWQRFLRFDPAEPIWPNRDRFVLSAGHASMLLYALLHLTGVQAVDPDYEIARPPVGQPRRHQDLPPARLEGRRATPSTAGPPASRRPPARSARAIATSVGMAVACKWLAAHFNRPGFELFDFDVYAIAGDGCLMEGVSNEAASFAGHQRLDNLCWIYDNNHITIDGHTEITYDDDVAARFMGYGWNVTRVGDANDLELLDRAFEPLPADRRPPDADHRRQPHRLRLAAQAGHRRRPRRAAGRGGGAGDQARLRLARGRRSSSSPTASTSTSPPGSARAGDELRERVGAAARRLPRASTSARAPRSTQMQRRELPDGWDARHPVLRRRRRRGSRRARPRTRSRTRSPRGSPGCVSGSADLTDSTSVRLDFDGAERLRARRPRTGASSTTASASTSRRRSRTGSRSRSCARRGRPTSSSPTTRGPRSGSRR